MAPLIGTLLTLAFLGLAPTGDPSYFCDAPPIAGLFGQRVEVDHAGFFDPRAKCNADAKGRVRWMGLVALVGTGLTVGTYRLVRRRDPSAIQPEADTPVA